MLVGYGYWGRKLARVMDRLGVLGAVIDASEDARVECGSTFPLVDAYGTLDDDLESVIAVSEEMRKWKCEGVVIATPASTHYALARGVLLAGRPVFVEKPMALSLEDARELVKQAADRGKLFVGHVFQYHPAIGVMRGLLARGYVGELEYVASTQVGPGRIRDQEDVIYSLAPHDVSMILDLVGERPTGVMASGQRYTAQSRMGTATIHLRFARCQAHAHVSWMSPEKRRQLTVIGTRRALVFDDVERRLTAYDRVPMVSAYKREGSNVFYSPLEPLEIEMQAFIDYVVTGEEPRSSGSKALGVMEVLDRASRLLEGAG